MTRNQRRRNPQPVVVMKKQAPRRRKPQPQSGIPWGKVARAGVDLASDIIPGGRIIKRGFDYISKIFGNGDYIMSPPVESNSFLHGTGTVRDSMGVPQFTGDRDVRIRHREYLGDVGGSTAFSLAAYPINPGQEATFPWLASVAQNFDEYEINGMVFEFISTSADALNSTNTNLGSVILATNYDSLDPNFINKQEMLEYEFATSARPSISQCHAIECKRKYSPLSRLYVRPGAVPTGGDLRLYDFGKFEIATVAQQATTTGLGELWVSYDITLFKPKMFGGSLGNEINLYQASNATAGQISETAFMGTSLVVSPGTNMAVTISGNVVTFPSTVLQGNYVINYYCLGTSAVLSGSITTLVNCSNLNIPGQTGGTPYKISNAGQTSVMFLLEQYVKVTGPSATVTFSFMVLPGAAVLGILSVSQLPGSAV